MDCELLFNDAGELVRMNGDWTFTPGKPATYVIGVIPDAEYLDFGYWVIETPGNDGPVYEVGTFAMGKGSVAVDPGTWLGRRPTPAPPQVCTSERASILTLSKGPRSLRVSSRPMRS